MALLASSAGTIGAGVADFFAAEGDRGGGRDGGRDEGRDEGRDFEAERPL
eukprot:CAMPEP_0198281028 /NCGR_PEP_ID=MMETSP1449-20131203/1052_1 /TAXON_ID=420275 /ORGANISM="Attheya septentrionalis, Strain CCMP2084" /LENGTH=49 /DNA_ID= /DNA_START= /DNA_END= /DNA_ORIENTATION=